MFEFNLSQVFKTLYHMSTISLFVCAWFVSSEIISNVCYVADYEFLKMTTMVNMCSNDIYFPLLFSWLWLRSNKNHFQHVLFSCKFTSTPIIFNITGLFLVNRYVLQMTVTFDMCHSAVALQKLPFLFLYFYYFSAECFQHVLHTPMWYSADHY